MQLKIDDLQPWARKALDEAYRSSERRGGRASREDFSEGFIAALVWARSWSSFRPESRPGP